MDRMTFLALAPQGTSVICWSEPHDDGDTYTAIAPNGELVTAWSGGPLLAMVRNRVRPTRPVERARVWAIAA